MTATNALVALLWAAVVATTTATPYDVRSACSDIKAAVPGKLFYPQDREYNLENTDYYNIGLAELKPTCIFQPTKATEVSEAVKILNKYKDVPFAVKSGGHDPNEGHSSVKDGVLIALSKMSFAQYDKSRNVAQFGPGGHWSEVISALDKKGVTVVGGRLGKCDS
jgi:FAD/FMN-containing dehydrogenase